MSSPEPRLLLTFHSVHDAMAAEARLAAAGLALEMIPLPRVISSDCGYCLVLGLPSIGELEERLGGREGLLALSIEGGYLVWESELPGRARRERQYERSYPQD